MTSLHFATWKTNDCNSFWFMRFLCEMFTYIYNFLNDGAHVAQQQQHNGSSLKMFLISAIACDKTSRLLNVRGERICFNLQSCDSVFGSSSSVRTVFKSRCREFIFCFYRQQKQPEASASSESRNLNSQLGLNSNRSFFFFCLFYDCFQIVFEAISRLIGIACWRFTSAQQWIFVFLAF